jgi:uncharacterized membrane protein YphA (DoxX/SURF4 family)
MPALSSLNVWRRDADYLAHLALRFGVGAAFLWFGLDKWTSPEAWLGWLPTWVALVPLPAQAIMIFGGTMEALLGVAVMVGWRAREVSLVAIASLVLASALGGVTSSTIQDGATGGALLALFARANQRARRPLASEGLATIVSIFLLLLLMAGVLYLRSGA